MTRAKRWRSTLLVLSLASLTWGCTPTTPTTAPTPEPAPTQSEPTEEVLPTGQTQAEPTEEVRPTEPIQGEPTKGAPPTVPAQGISADVLAVTVSGEPGAYQFSVQISSPDLGCQQYADWWEVFDEDGGLVYRRILAHSHVDEQPFTRSGGPVPIEADTVVWVRAHINPGGYGGITLRGSVQAGFTPEELSPGFAADLAETPPLPDGCAF